MLLATDSVFPKLPIEGVRQLSSGEMAIVALVVQNFMDIMFEEVKKAGFTNLEFLEKSQLFMLATTPSYPRNDFDILLSVLAELDERFRDTKFYYGLVSLRELCTQENGGSESILEGLGVTISDKSRINSSVVIFSTHLISNIISFIRQVRSYPSIQETPVDELRCMISSQFQACLLKTVSEVVSSLSGRPE